MARVSGGIPNLINGISQQPPALRLASQGEVQVNAYSTVVNGLTKRPPSNYIAALTHGTFLTNVSWVNTHVINRDETEQYVVVADKTGSVVDLNVYDFQGNEEVVNINATAQAYLQTASRDDLRFLTVADYTIVLNQNAVVGMTSEVEPERPAEAVVNVKAGNYARTYSITVNGQLVGQYIAPNGESASEGPQIDVTYIATQLAIDLVTRGIVTAANGWTVQRTANTLYLSHASDFTIEVDDGFSGRAMNVVKDEVENFSDLPFFCRHGMLVQVTNSAATNSDNYYVKFESTNAGFGRGVWRESAGEGVSLSLDPATLPQALIRQANGTFTLEPLNWNKRLAGDEDTLPGPSFVGRRLSDVFFFKNRLGFLSDENVVMSRAGDFFNFFRTTATNLLDDDPIDIAVTHDKVSILNHAVAFQDRLILFSTQTQFQLRGSELLTPKTVSLRPTTEFESSSKAPPIGTGRNIYFPVDRGEFTMLREYFFDDTTELADADDVTSHVPQYVPGGVTHIEASSHEDVLVCLSEQQKNTLYVYKYLWIDNNKAQSSWSTWTFPGVSEILDIAFVESSLFAVVVRDNDLYLEKTEVQPGVKDPGSAFVTHLDRRVRLEGPNAHTSYDPVADRTVFTLPYVPDDTLVCVTAGTSTYIPANPAGLPVQVVSKDGTNVTVQGDYRQTPVYFGILYETRYRISTVYIRQEAPTGGVQAITHGRLQLHHMQFQYSNTGFFEVEVTPLARETRKYFFNGRLVGDPENIAGVTVLSDGSYRFPVLSQNDRVKVDIVTDSYLPFAITSVEWAGMYVNNTRRV